MVSLESITIESGHHTECEKVDEANIDSVLDQLQ